MVQRYCEVTNSARFLPGTQHRPHLPPSPAIPSVPQPMKGLLSTPVLSVCSHMFLACLSLTPPFCPSLSLLLCPHHSSVCLSTFLLVCPYPFSKVPLFPQINPLYQICCMVSFLSQTPWHGPTRYPLAALSFIADAAADFLSIFYQSTLWQFECDTSHSLSHLNIAPFGQLGRCVRPCWRKFVTRSGL